MDAFPTTGVLAAAVPDRPADRLAALFNAHYDRLYRLARRLVPNGDEASDLVQETFLRAARSPKSIPSGLTSEEAWLVRVLVNIRRDQWRREAVRRRHDRATRLATNEGTSQEAAFMAHAIVWRALDILTPRRRAVVVMHELEGLTTAAIAALLGVSAVTVRWHLSRGRRELARALRPQVGAIDEHH